MKKAFVVFVLAWFMIGSHAFSAARDAQWKKVDEAIQKGLPRTAIEALEPIIQGALQDKAYGEATKALARKIVLEGNIQGNKPEEKIVRLEAEIAKAPKEMAPMLETILANWYWHYFQNNRWRFMQRAATAQAPGKDFTTWDLPRLFAEIDRHFQAALGAAEALKQTPVSAFNDLLQKGTMPDATRPTLYDFIAQEALKFYTSGEQAAAKPQAAFEVPAESPVFAPAEQFIAWKIETGDTNSPAYKALRLYQDLLQFHARDQDPTAFISADLDRLAYGENAAFGEEKNSRYQAALKRIVDQWADHELTALALHQWARVVHQEGDWVAAHRLAERGAKVFPDSPGGKLCRNLMVEIEAKSSAISTERVWNQPWPKIAVQYRNLNNIYFRAVAYDWDKFLDRKHNRPESLNPQERKQLLETPPVLEWQAKLPPTPDFKERVGKLPAPENLKPGFYFLIASHDPNFGDQNNQVTFTDVWVSELALVVRPRDGNIEGFVLDARSGEPLAGAEVNSWFLDNQGNRVAGPNSATDTNGFFSFRADSQRPYLLRARHAGRELGSHQDYWAPQHEGNRPFEQTLFFTDRALYRPGQIIQYKGICLRVNQEKDDYELLKGQALTVVFADANGKEIARQPQRCNDYGSFAGSFTAPRDRLMGTMSLRVEQGPNGAAHFNIEEYKRPKFQVTLDAPKTAARLRDKVSLQGHAMAYTRAAVDGAQVRYRIVREVRMPYWWNWYSRRAPRWQSSQEIAHGVASTDANGLFVIEFAARPDLAVPEKDEPTFIFNISADVTDSAGETRSAERGITVGYTALQAVLGASDWQTVDKPVELTLTTQTLDGEAQTAEGSLKVYRLQAPAEVQRPPLGSGHYRGVEPVESASEDLSDPNQWPLGEVAVEKGWTTDASGRLAFQLKLGVGAYRAVIETQDRFGKKVKGQWPILVVDPNANQVAIKIPHLLAAPSWSVEPGAEFMALWGTGYDRGRAFIEIEHRHKMIARFWTKPGDTQQQINHAVTEAMRGGFTLHVTQVRENRAYLSSRHVDVPWTNKELELSWEHFTSKLQPNQKETWTLVVKKPMPEKGKKAEGKNDREPAGKPLEAAVAEMAAALYDESLDAFLPHQWQQRFSIFRQDYSTASPVFENVSKQFQRLQGRWDRPMAPVAITYWSFPPDLTANVWRYGWPMRKGIAPASRFPAYAAEEGVVLSAAPAQMASMAEAPAMGLAFDAAKEKAGVGGGAADKEPGQSNAAKSPDLSQVAARKNLNETAFFFPQLLSDSNGVVKLQFAMPEALTQWKFMGFAHDQALRSGYLEGKTVTAKDLMVQPNPPRFLREGDTVEFTVKVSNQTAARQTGKVRLTFNQALNDQAAEPLLGNATPELAFDIPAKQSLSYAWKITVPDGIGFLTYKAVASTGRVSDGEEGYLPVLSRRILVTESLELPIRGPATRQFEFTKLLQAGQSQTLRHQSLTVQMASNPAWYAVLALPYLMEYPYECSEQVFNRFYANSLARNIAGSDPRIRRVFDQWKNTPALDSPLEKNADLKSVALEETPWLRQAQSESQARRDVGLLFDDNRLNYELDRALRKLMEMQLPDGAWPWFPGGPGNDYITLYITTGFGRLRHLGVDLDPQPAIRALVRLDNWIDERYRWILQHHKKEDNHLDATIALYLYGRSFFLKDQPIPPRPKEAVDYFLGQARAYWLQLDNRQSQGHLALALHRFGDPQAAAGIMRSIKERSVIDNDLGRFWRDTELSWWWYRAPIETQGLMIEAFDEVMNDASAVEECKVWLLKQKQTQDWKTTKATADAVYALLLRGRELLASQELVQIELDGRNITPKTEPGKGQNAAVPAGGAAPQVEPGTGFYEQKFTAAEIKPALGKITVKKLDPGVAWGGIHWQYLEDVSRVTPHEGTPLKLRKTIFKKTDTEKGPVLEPAAGALKVGDELVVRVELRTDRDMEYVHLKDQRGSGTEPLNVISRYKFQDGLGYYESTRDTASHFFIDYLPKGVYVFEYSSRIQLRGQYQTGIAEIQCMYAPEFNSHSESHTLRVE